MKTHTQEYKKIIVPIIEKHLPAARVILYGSRARGDDKPGSDIDVAIDAGAKIEDDKMSAIYWDIEESSLPICFDVLDFHSVSESMQKEILKDGVVWKNYE